MSFILQFGIGPILRGISPAEDFSIALVPQTVTSSTDGTTTNVRDGVIETITDAVIDYVFAVQVSDSLVDPGVVITNLTPGIATFTDGAPATYVANGQAQVQASHPIYGTKIATCAVWQQTFSSAPVFNGYVSGSLASDLSALIAGAVGTTGASSANTGIFQSNSNSRNTSLWCDSIVDLTAITRDPGGGGTGGTFTYMVLVGPRHILTAAHVCPSVGAVMVWCDNNGVAYAGAVSATVTGVTGVTPNDVAICYIRDATSAEMTAYNAAYPSMPPVSHALSAASAGFSSSAPIKPMALLPAAVWAANAGTESSPSPTCVLPMDSYLSTFPNYRMIPTMHVTRSGCIGIWGILEGPHTQQISTGSGSFTNYPDELGIIPSTMPYLSTYSEASIVGSTASGDQTFSAIPAGSTLASANSGLGAGYPILLGTTHDGQTSANYFNLPWTPAFISGITAAMQSTAQAAGDPSYASYTPYVLSTSGYTSY